MSVNQRGKETAQAFRGAQPQLNQSHLFGAAPESLLKNPTDWLR